MIESGQKYMTRNKIIGIVLITFLVISSGVIGAMIFYLYNNLSYTPDDKNPIIQTFRSQWDTTKTSVGSSNDNQIRLPLVSDGIMISRLIGVMEQATSSRVGTNQK